MLGSQFIFLWILNPALCFSGISFLLLCLFSSIPWASLIGMLYHHSRLLGACLTNGSQVSVLMKEPMETLYKTRAVQQTPGVDLFPGPLCSPQGILLWMSLLGAHKDSPEAQFSLSQEFLFFFTFLLSRGYSFPTITFISACLTSIVTGRKQSQQIPEQLLRT